MIDRIKTEIKKTQEILRERQNQLAEQADDIVEQARHKAHLVRGDGAERLWHFENQALDWVDDMLGRGDVPGSDLVKEPVGRWVQQARQSVTANPVENYEVLNARAAADTVRELGVVDLLRIERIEKAGKARKTVFEAIERRRNQLQKPPFRESAA